MPVPYGPEAIEYCLRLYLKYNGQNHDRIEAEMRRAGWSGWTKKNLHTRGKGKAQRLGWIEKYSWEEALKQHLAQRPLASLNSAEALVREVESVRKTLYAQLQAEGANAAKDRIYQHRDYCKLSIDALTKVEAARDTLGGFVNFWEHLLDWLPEFSDKAIRELLKVSDQILERAAAEYGDNKEATAGG